jgi:hypothetical protein
MMAKANGDYVDVPLKSRGEGGDNEEEEEVDSKEQIIDAIGGFGKWQMYKCCYIIGVIWVGASFSLLNMVFYR